MSEIKVIQINESIFAENDRAAELIRKRLTRQGTLFLNVMSSPGSGKTTTLVALINRLKEQITKENLDTILSYNVSNEQNKFLRPIPEGDDKPLKYPLMYTVSDVVLINKMDALPYFDFDLEKAKERILKLNPKAIFFPISAKTGEGLDAVCAWILSELEKIRGAKI